MIYFVGFQEPQIRLMKIKNKKDKKLRKKRMLTSPEWKLEVLPQVLVVLSAVQLWACFYNVMKMLIRGIKGIKIPAIRIPDKELGLLTSAILQLMFRKPPDKVIALTDELVVVCKPR